jgi:hypothetical protein
MVRAKVRVPRGYGVFSNPKKAVYNRIYRKTTIGLEDLEKKQK